jgi:DNA-binding transcriptional ArsR family regulator
MQGPKTSKMIHEKILELVARRFQVLGEPCRLRILHTLQGGAMTVGQIVERLDGNQPNISKHLQVLYDSGLVGRRRSGNSVFYSITDRAVFRLCELVCHSTARRAASLQRYALAKPVNGIHVRASHRQTRVGSLQGIE